jgi:hypothetical protein
MFARRDYFGQKGRQGLKPLIPAMVVGTPENTGRSSLFSLPSLPAGWQNNTTEVVP